jgi:hypothetical protein
MTRLRAPFLGIVFLSIAFAPGLVWAQGQLVPLVTSDAALPLPSTFGTQSTVVRNQAGDVAVVDTIGTAVHLKKNGTSTWTRIVQTGDEVPGLDGSRINAVVAVRLNASGLVAMGVELNLASGEPQSAVLIHNGVSLINVVDGTDTAPSSGGARFNRGLALAGLSDTGSIVVTSPLLLELPAGMVPLTIFVVPNSGTPARLAGPGDPAPGTTTTFQSQGVSEFNSSGQVLIGATLADTRSAFFLGTTPADLHKVVAKGDPNPTGGIFSGVGNGRLNNLGRVAFTAFGGTSSGVFVAEPNLTVTQIFANGTPTTILPGGTIAPAFVLAFNDAGTVLFQSDVFGPTGSSRGMFRITPGSPLQTVVYRNQPVAGATIGDFVGTFDMNVSGATAFKTSSPDGSPLGIYYQSGSNLPIRILQHGGPSGVAGGGTVDLSRSLVGPVLDDGRTILHITVAGGAVDVAYVLRTSGGVTTMLLSTNDELPAGGRTLLSDRSIGVRGSGSFVSFKAMRAGGAVAAFVHHLPSQVTTRVAASGDVVHGTSDRLLMTASNAVFVNSAGQLVVSGLLSGSTGIRSGIVIASAGGGLQKVVAEGDQDSEGRVLTSPIPFEAAGINSSGQVPFVASNGSLRGIWVGVAGAPPAKLVMAQDPRPGGSFSNVGLPQAINDAGQVLFSGDESLYLRTPGGPVQKIVLDGEAAPGGGTFYHVGPGTLNNAGQVAFTAGVFDGSGFDEGALFVGSASGPPVVIAVYGAAAPGGGTFATTLSEVLINDRSDVFFRSDLTGTSADSGYFIRRGPAGAVEALVRAGDPAPGTAFTFLTLRFSGTKLSGVQLNGSGGVTFLGDYFDGSGKVSNYWYIGRNGVVEPVAVGVPPAFGGGSAVRVSPTSSWAGATYPIWARITGGSFVEGVFLFVPSTTTPVEIGSNVQVTPVDPTSGQAPLTATFETVTGAGVITLTVSATGPTLPADYVLGTPPRYYDVATTATYAGSIVVCINFNDLRFPPGSAVRLLHYSAGAWSDVTTAVAGGIACGSVTSLSPFAVAGLTTPGPNLVQNGDFSGGLASWTPFATPDLSYIQVAVNSGVLEFYRVPPPPGQTNQAVVFQRTGVALESGTPLVAAFDLGNSSSVRKRISVLIQDADFSDLFVCTFWLPANLPLSTYAIRTHATKAWANATIAFYAATAGSAGGAYQIDNVSLRAFAAGVPDRTECVDPTRPAPPGGPDSPTLIVNGDFSAGFPPWGDFGMIGWQIMGGVLEFYRVSGTPAGVVLQQTQQPAPVGEIFTATFELGSTFTTRSRVTVLLHDNDFTDLAACTFWLAPGQPLQPYAIRMFATKAWTNATLSFYPVTASGFQSVRLDNVALRRTPGVTFNGTDCLEPAPPDPIPPAARAKERK